MTSTMMRERMRQMMAYMDAMDGCQPEGAYSTAFRATVAEQGDAWSREARLVLALAARLNICLDEELLKVSDVRDLQALGGMLAERLGRRRAA